MAVSRALAIRIATPHGRSLQQCPQPGSQDLDRCCRRSPLRVITADKWSVAATPICGPVAAITGLISVSSTAFMSATDIEDMLRPASSRTARKASARPGTKQTAAHQRPVHFDGLVANLVNGRQCIAQRAASRQCALQLRRIAWASLVTGTEGVRTTETNGLSPRSSRSYRAEPSAAAASRCNPTADVRGRCGLSITHTNASASPANSSPPCPRGSRRMRHSKRFTGGRQYGAGSRSTTQGPQARAPQAIQALACINPRRVGQAVAHERPTHRPRPAQR